VKQMIIARRRVRAVCGIVQGFLSYEIIRHADLFSGRPSYFVRNETFMFHVKFCSTHHQVVKFIDLFI
jgi:hypothetical protein